VAGPFETEREAREATRIYPAGALPGDWIRETNLAMLHDAITAGGRPARCL
jgi:hypothetical protein